ncbi:MAG: alpha-ketoacid dehydrogenase subunit beta [Actinobacteria bacterium]|nr:alpha-ketoacid dehydrogenase subunit beta [Actinomycetota bacterium]
MRKLRYLKAVSEGLRQQMVKDKNIFVIGEDVRESLRGITKGFIDEFGPERVIDTPISEAGFTGIGTGAAFLGMRPVLEYQISEFVFFAFDQLIDQAQKLRYMSGGKLKVPVTYIIVGAGAKGGMAGQHSDNPYPYILHGGMKTVIPSTPYDAKGLLVSAIRDDDPVAFFLPINIQGMKGSVPEEEYSIPLGKGEIKKEGKDITVVAVGHLVSIALEVAEKAETEGRSIEVFDPRTLLPLDKELLKKSVSKTGRVIIFDDSNRTCGYAAEISAFISEECFKYLKAPIKRITRADVPVPFSRTLEQYVLPDEKKLFRAINNIF